MNGINCASIFLKPLPMYRTYKCIYDNCIKNYLSNENNITLEIIDDYNLKADYIESQAFAFLAIRSFLNLPISFSTTTGCKEFTVGGKLVKNF